MLYQHVLSTVRLLHTARMTHYIVYKTSFAHMYMAIIRFLYTCIYMYWVYTVNPQKLTAIKFSCIANNGRMED